MRRSTGARGHLSARSSAALRGQESLLAPPAQQKHPTRPPANTLHSSLSLPDGVRADKAAWIALAPALPARRSILRPTRRAEAPGADWRDTARSSRASSNKRYGAASRRQLRPRPDPLTEETAPGSSHPSAFGRESGVSDQINWRVSTVLIPSRRKKAQIVDSAPDAENLNRLACTWSSTFKRRGIRTKSPELKIGVAVR